MQITLGYEKEFDALIDSLRERFPQELFNLDGIGKQLDICEFSKKFFASKVTADVSIDANANVDDTSVITYNNEAFKPLQKINSYYILWEQLKKEHNLEFANKVIEMQIFGDLYIHDVHGIASGLSYCFNYSTYDIMIHGLPMIKKIRSLPPKYLYSFKSQLEQFTIIASNSTLGATGLADMLLVMSYYVDNIYKNGHDAGVFFDGWFSDSEKQIIEDMIGQIPPADKYGNSDIEIEKITKNINQTLNKKKPHNPAWFKANVDRWFKENLVSFIYTINQPLRASQSPFTNLSIYDRTFLSKIQDNYIFPDDSTFNIDTVLRLQEIFLDTMNEELRRTPITFPVVTACFAIDENNNILDKDFVRFIARKNQEFGFINMFNGDSSILSSCCRLRSSMENEYFNSFGSGSTKIGSLGVVSGNLPRLATRCIRDKTDFLESLKTLVTIAAQINNAKREIVKKRIDSGNLPLYTLGFMDINKQYSTFGVNGLYEALEILGYDILTERGQNFVLEILDVINSTNNKMQDYYQTPHNCEQVPGENMSIKAAQKDRLLGFNDKYELYSNQFIPLITKADMLDRMKAQGLFDKHFSGGAACHINIDAPIDNIEQIVDLILLAAKLGIVYWSINFNLQECAEGHMGVGKGESCVICGAPVVNNYLRVVGFLVNTKNFHRVRREMDYPNRQFYSVKEVSLK